MITAQTLLTGLIVLLCALYAAWSLMPRAARRGLAGLLLRLPLPQRLSRRLEKSRVSASGCGSGCGGCDSAAPKAAAPVQIVKFQANASGRPHAGH